MFTFWKVYQVTFSCVIHVHPSCFLLDIHSIIENLWKSAMKSASVPEALLHGWRQWEPVDFCGPTEDQGQLPLIRWVKLLDDFLIVQLSQFYPSSLRVGTKGKRCNKRLGWQRRVPNWILTSWGTRDSHTFLYQRCCPPQKDTKKANLFSRPATKNIQLFSNLGQWLRLPTLWE